MKTLRTGIGTPLDLRSVRPPAKRVDPYYLTPEHQAWRDRVIARAGARCEDPEHDPRRPRSGIRLFADHIRELQDGGARLDLDNGMARCGSCHSRKTAVERDARASRQ
jgi:5-methylcytosine-specific restriction protein A